MVVESARGSKRKVASTASAAFTASVMSTGKRLAKRSIVGTRVCAPAADGMYYAGVIAAVKTPAAAFAESANCINLTPHTRYTVRFDAARGGAGGRATAEFLDGDLIGPGFRSVGGLHLLPGQRVFVTYKGREVAGEVIQHTLEPDEVFIQIGTDVPFQVQKRLDDVRLLESRKSARLADSDTDFARLADMSTERGKRSHTIDVPATSPNHYTGSRKRRPSNSQEDSNQMEECNAALVLMSLSCSPHSSNLSNMSWAGTSPGSSSSHSSGSSASSSWRASPSPSPSETGCYPSTAMVPLSSSSGSDEGIVLDYPDDMPRKKKPISCTSYQCTWKTCNFMTQIEEYIKEHIRAEHPVHAGEEEFYYNDVPEPSPPPAPLTPPQQQHLQHPQQLQLQQQPPPAQPAPPPTMLIQQPQPTLSHRDMARPPHEDPEYQRQIVGSYRQQMIYSGPIAIPQSPHKLMKLSPRPHSPKMPVSPRRARGENKKCRKVYGMEHREQWCTQCKWKKACTRFGD